MPENATAVTGRLAPSPTGLLHLGNAWAFLLAWCMARAQGGRILLRMEDLDPDRSRDDFAQAIIHDLRWLGLDWDAGPYTSPPIPSEAFAPPGSAASPTATAAVPPGMAYTQSARLACYQAALDRLDARGHIYPCYCTRKELRQLAGAPHVDDAGAPYPGLCRHLTQDQRREREAAGRTPCLRLRCPDETLCVDDAIYGPQRFSLAECGGDFALRRSDGVMAYQLAVVVDDADMGVTQVVRGRDILISTPRQMLLCRLLGLPTPHYAHVPLLLDASGERLAKRHQSLSLQALRDSGIRPEAVTGLLGWLAGCLPAPRPAAPRELLPAFDAALLPREDQRITAAMLAGLR